MIYGDYMNYFQILDNSKEIVYLYYSNEEYNHKVPAVNIKKISNEINNSIYEFVNPYIDKEYYFKDIGHVFYYS